MSYPSNYNEWQYDRFNMPLEAPPFDDFHIHFEAQTAYSSHPSKRPQPIPSALDSNPNSWHSSSSSNPHLISGNYSLPSSSRPSGVSPLSLYSIPNTSSPNTHPPLAPFVPLTEDVYTFLANIDPSLLETDIVNAINNSTSYMPETARHGSSHSRKRPRADEEPKGPNASIDTFSNIKRRRLSTDGHQSLPSVPPPTNAYNYGNNVVTSTFNDFSLPASTSRANMMLSPTPYPTPRVFRSAPPPSDLFPPAPPVLLPPLHTGATQFTPWWNPNAELYAPPANLSHTPPQATNIPPAYPPETQFYPNAYEGAADYGDLNTDAEIGPQDWTTGFLGPEYFYTNTGTAAAFPVPSSVVVPPLLEQHHTNAVVNNTTHSSVVDFRQHSIPTSRISTTEHVANATMPNAEVPSTSGAPSIDRQVITYDIVDPSTPPSSPSPTRKRPKKRKPTLYPDPKLWFFDKDAKQKYVCRYDGPDCPMGCEQRSDTPRNLGRHMRKHAKGEASMRNLSENERVALNGLPEGLLRVEAKCRLAHGNLHECSFYRRHGRRWAVMTMERRENLERKHRDRYHDVDQ